MVDCLPGSAHLDVHVHKHPDLPETGLPVNQEVATDRPETLPASESTLEGSSSSLSLSLSSTRQLISELYYQRLVLIARVKVKLEC